MVDLSLLSIEELNNELKRTEHEIAQYNNKQLSKKVFL